MNAESRNLAARAREAARHTCLWADRRNLLAECADALDRMQAAAVKRNRIIRRLRRRLEANGGR